MTPPSAHESAERAGARRGSPRHEPSPRTSGPEVRLRVSYYGRVKPNRVYPLTVRVPSGHKTEGPASIVTIRPVVPGAIVTPVEQQLDLSRPGEALTFHVASFAKGRLTGARVEVLDNGRLVDNLPMTIRGKTQRLTWLLLLLTFLIPGLLYLHATNPTRGVIEEIRKRVSRPEGPIGPPGEEPGAGDAEEVPNKPNKPNKPNRPFRPGGADDVLLPGHVLLQDPTQVPEGKKGGEKPKGGKGRDEEAGAGGVDIPQEGGVSLVDALGPTEKHKREGTPEEYLSYRLNQVVLTDAALLPSEPETRSQAEVTWWENGIKTGTHGIGYAYGVLIADPTLCFWIGVVLLLLTFGSWFVRRPYRTSTTRTVKLPAPRHLARGREAQSAETLPLGSSPDDEPPLAVQPVD